MGQKIRRWKKKAKRKFSVTLCLCVIIILTLLHSIVCFSPCDCYYFLIKIRDSTTTLNARKSYFACLVDFELFKSFSHIYVLNVLTHIFSSSPKFKNTHSFRYTYFYWPVRASEVGNDCSPSSYHHFIPQKKREALLLVCSPPLPSFFTFSRKVDLEEERCVFVPTFVKEKKENTR